MIRLVLADDHAIVRSGLTQIFSLLPDIEVLAQATNGAEMLQALHQHKNLNLVLLDLNMEGITGADLIARIKAHRPHVPILVLSMHNEPQVAARMLRAGASGYVTKDCNPDVLLLAMRRVVAGGKYIVPALAERMVFEVAQDDAHPPHSRLSDREGEVLRRLTRGCNARQIGEQMSISSKTASTYKLRLMKKLQLANMAELMRYAAEHDLLG